ncbi:hypothetical protein ATCC90586_011210 [Pythium insidiosum]|nr:hypothetical protein ATCC90586_011210 [Pythium insidiosum]
MDVPADASGESTSPLKRRSAQVVMRALSFVAVYSAASSPADEIAATSDLETRSIVGDSIATDSRGDDDDRLTTVESRPEKAVVVPADASASSTLGETEPQVWLAQLLDDVTDDKIGTDSTVRATKLNCIGGSAYERTHDVASIDVVVKSILCLVSVQQVDEGRRLELTHASITRVERCLRRLRGEVITEDEEAFDEEQPPSADQPETQVAKRPKIDVEAMEERKVCSGHQPIGAGRIPPRYASVRLEAHEDRELSGTHGLSSFGVDVISANREPIRALRTRNNELLRRLVETPHVRREIQSFTARQSADVDRTAFDYAVACDDAEAVNLLLKTSGFLTSTTPPLSKLRRY